MTTVDLRREDITTADTLMARLRDEPDLDVEAIVTRDQMLAIYGSVQGRYPVGKDQQRTVSGRGWHRVELRVEPS